MEEGFLEELDRGVCFHNVKDLVAYIECTNSKLENCREWELYWAQEYICLFGVNDIICEND